MKYIYKKWKTFKYMTHIEHAYVVLDRMLNPEVIHSQREYNELDRVETWFNSTYNRPKMRPYKERRAK